MAGLASATVNIIDSSASSQNNNAGVIAVVGMTERGDLNKPIIVGSTLEYIRKFGKELPVAVSLFPYYCMRALERGAKLMIVPLVHAGVGVKASTSLGGGGLIATAKREGLYGNDITLKIIAPASRTASVVDVYVSNSDSTLFQKYSDVSTTQTASTIAILNATSNFIVFDAGVTSFTIGVYPFISGTNATAPTSVDYAGNQAQKTGFYALDSSLGFRFISAMDNADNTTDNALNNYCLMRGDCYPLLRTPLGLSGDAVLQYFNAVSPYAGTPIDSLGRMITGGQVVNHPEITGATLTVSSIVALVVGYSRIGINGRVWESVGLPKYGTYTGINDVIINFASPALKSDADAIVNAGIIPFVKTATGEFRVFGNTTLQRKTSLLSSANIADLALYIKLETQKIVNKYLFEPNDVPTWRAMYSEISKVFNDLKTNRAIYSYQYFGDQDVAKAEDVSVNTFSDVQLGKYKAIARVYPINALTQIELGINIASGVAIVTLNA
jgi:hypothetical protein